MFKVTFNGVQILLAIKMDESVLSGVLLGISSILLWETIQYHSKSLHYEVIIMNFPIITKPSM
jgi:hypothetical protein